jgi:aspartokinase
MNNSTLALIIGVLLGTTGIVTYNSFNPPNECTVSSDVKQLTDKQQQTIDSLSTTNNKQLDIISSLGDDLKKNSESMNQGMKALTESLQVMQKSCK